MEKADGHGEGVEGTSLREGMKGMSKIEWTDETWNPVTGCSKVSEGCRNCYAERLSHRFRWTEKPWNGQHAKENVKLHPERLEQPLHWKKPRMVFVNSMSDLFHEEVSFEFIEEVFGVMALAKKHTFQILTKRPRRMLDFFQTCVYNGHFPGSEPLSNVWLGVSVENQKAANERIPYLLETPASVRFLSCEPLLGPVNLEFMVGTDHPENEGYGFQAIKGIDWVIVGGESGPGARPMNSEWVLTILDQCQEAGVAFFFKQWGEWVCPVIGQYEGEFPPTDRYDYWDGETGTIRVGKKKAGRLIDGREWNEMPRVREKV